MNSMNTWNKKNITIMYRQMGSVMKFTRNVWIDSEINLIGDGTNVKVVFQPNSFSINSGEQMKLQITTFEMRQNWYSIAIPNSIIYWYGKTTASPGTAVFTPVIIPAGSYRTFDGVNGLASGISTGMLDAKDTGGNALFSGATVTWNNVARTWSIVIAGATDTDGFFVSFQVKEGTQPAGVSTIGFYNDSNEIYGAYTTSSYTGNPAELINMFVKADGSANPTGNTTYISPFVGQLSSLEAVFIRVSLPTNSFQTYGFERDLKNSSGITNSAIWARIPLVNSVYEDLTPFLTFTENGGDNFSMYLQQKQLDTMIMQITDDKNRNISLYAPVGSASNGSLSFKMCMRWDILDNTAITPKVINVRGLEYNPPIIKP